MPWSWVDSKFSIHQVQHTLSTAYTKYIIDPTSTVSHSKPISHLSSLFTGYSCLISHHLTLGGPSCAQLSTLASLHIHQYIMCQLKSFHRSNLAPPGQSPRSTPPTSLNCCHQVHLNVHIMLNYKCTYIIALSQPPGSHNDGHQVDPWLHWITFSNFGQ